MAFAAIGTIAGAVLGTGTAVGAIGGALIGGAAGGLLSNVTSGAPSAGQVSSTQLSEQKSIFGEQQYYAGLLKNLIADPSSVTSLPGYQFQFEQGQQALQRVGAGTSGVGAGGAPSGTTATALVQYGQGYASNFLQQQEQLLSSLSGLTAPTSAGAAGSNAIQSQNAQFNQLGALLASLGYAGTYNFSSAGSPGTPSDPWAQYFAPGYVQPGNADPSAGGGQPGFGLGGGNVSPVVPQP